MWRLLAGAVAGALLLWLAFVAALWWRRPSEGALRESLRLFPDTLRLVRRLAVDESLPRSVRVRLWLLLAYLALPLDLVPDVVPVVGLADDVIVAGIVLRGVVRRAGPDAVRRHWPGTPDGLAVVWRLAGLPQ